MNIKLKAIVSMGFFALWGFSTVGGAASVDELEKRIENLETDIEMREDETEDLKKKIDKAINISGYVDVEYVEDDRSSKRSGFRLHHMSLFFTKQLSDRWKFFSEIEYEDGPFIEGPDDPNDVKGKIFLEAVNFDYEWRDQQFGRGGRFFTPAGIWSIDHYPPFVPTQERPMHIRKIFPQVIEGAMAHGTVPVGSTYMNYDLYVGNGEGNSNPGKSDGNSEKALGGKVSFILPQLKYLELGASYFTDTNATTNDEKDAYGVHAKLKLDAFTLQAEYADGEITPDSGSGSSYDKVGYYAQLLYDIRSWTLGGRHDFYAENDKLDKDETRNSVFVNYHVDQNIVLKLEYHKIEDDDVSKENYTKTIGSVVYYLD